MTGVTIPSRHQISPIIIAGADQIPGSLLLDRRDPDRDDLTQTQQPGQMQRVTTVGLHPIPRRTLQLRRGRDHTLDPGRRERPGEPEACWASLIRDRSWLRKPASPVQDLADLITETSP